MSKNLKRTSSTVKFAKDFILVSSSSLGGLWFFEYRFTPIILDVDCSNEALGEAVFEALKHSREMPLDEFDELFRSGFLERKYAEFESSLMERFNYKNKRQLYKTMKAVYVNGIENRIELVSTHQDSLDGFCGIEGLKPIVTSFDVSAEILGEKVREAYQLSTSKYK